MGQLERNHDYPRYNLASTMMTRRFRDSLFGMLPGILLWLYLSSGTLGHLLLWDEAMQLCTLRSFLNGGDYFSYWFWRHPPLMSLIMYLCGPFQAGFDLRVECLVIAIGAINIVLLYLLNTRILGQRAALWISLIHASLPGQLLLGVWIKTDHLVVTAGLLALLMLHRGRVLGASIMLGIAMLTKETAIFYLLAAILIVMASRAPLRSIKNFMYLISVPIVLSAWWYTAFGNGLPIHQTLEGGLGRVSHRAFAISNADWAAGTWQYIMELPILLGWVGGVLGVTGLCVIAIASRGTEASNLSAGHRLMQLWPIFVLLPAYAVISLIPSKVPWIVTVLLPAWSTLIGLSLERIERLACRTQRSASLRFLLVLLMLAVLFQSQQHSYNEQLQRLVPTHWRGAEQSRSIAMTLDRHARPGDRVLLSSFHYWKGLDPVAPCAVFTYYSKAASNCDMVMRASTATFEELQDAVGRYEIDWAVLSPPPGPLEHDVFGGFTRQFGPPIPCDGAYIFNTRQQHDD